MASNNIYNLLHMHALDICVASYHQYQGRRNLNAKLLVKPRYQEDLLALLLMLPNVTVRRATKFGTPHSIVWYESIILEPDMMRVGNKIIYKSGYNLHVRQWRLLTRDMREQAGDH